MASVNPQQRLLDASYDDFATSLLPLYSGPHVTIRIGSESQEYKLPKALLCNQSSYFKAMFEGSFREGEEQSSTLEEIDGVVSPRSFEVLVQWICLGRIVFRECAPEIAIATAIEFARLADMCCITGVESMMAKHIKAIILANPNPEHINFAVGRAPDMYTHCLTSDHITSSVALPEGHPVRAVLAAATVEGYINQHKYKFEKEVFSVPEYAFDILKALRTTTESIRGGDNPTFEDPISKAELYFRRV